MLFRIRVMTRAIIDSDSNSPGRFRIDEYRPSLPRSATSRHRASAHPRRRSLGGQRLGDGAPYLVPLSFDWDGEALLVATPAESPIGRNLAAIRTVRLGLGPTNRCPEGALGERLSPTSRRERRNDRATDRQLQNACGRMTPSVLEKPKKSRDELAETVGYTSGVTVNGYP